MKVSNQLRQGDVLLHPVNALPETAKRVKHKLRLVLAEGEATGHAHTISAPKNKIKHYLDGTELYLKVLMPVTLEHQEHAAITVDPGLYHVRRQTEIWLDEVRRVVD